MEEAKTLIRTAARTFYSIKHVLIIDALLTHSVLHLDDLVVLMSGQTKELRQQLNPLKAARLVDTHGRAEAKVNSTRGVQREYYYIPLHPAIDGIKYRIMKLRKRVETLYKQENKHKDYRCPRCKAEWDELEVLDKIGPEGFECHRCGNLLEFVPSLSELDGSHEKIRRLNLQLKKFDDLIAKIDMSEVPQNDFLTAWERKRDVPRDKIAGQTGSQYIDLNRRIKDDRAKGPDHTDASRLNINLTSGAEQEKEEAIKREERKAELAKQNQLPEWHRSAIGQGSTAGFLADSATANGVFKKEEDSDDKKPDLSMESEVDAYLADMERERQEEARRAAEEDAESPDEDGGDDDEDEFENVVGTSAAATPASSQQDLRSGRTSNGAGNGVKREFDFDSAPSSDANTPAAMIDTPLSEESGDRHAKRIKLENGIGRGGNLAGAAHDVAESSDEEDFEDV